MSVEGLAASFSSLLGGDFLVAQVGVLGATAVLFLSSLVLSVMSFRSAASSQRALREARDLTMEVRHLTAQIELSSRPPSAAPDREEAHDYVSEERQERSLDLREEDRADYQAEHLEAAKRAAIEPSALLRSRLRRR